MVTLETLLHLTRPLVLLDGEMTGLDCEKDRLIKLSCIWINVHLPPVAWSSLFNPECPILNSEIHGIADAMVADAPVFRTVAPELARRLLHVDLAGFHVTFDIDFLKAEFAHAQVEWLWNGYMIDASIIYRQKEPHTLTNAYKRYVHAAGFAGAHDSEFDVAATEEVLAGQLAEYADLPRTVKELSEWCFPPVEHAVDKAAKLIWVGNEVALGVGRHTGKLLKTLPRSYLQWMIKDDNNFSPEVKVIIREALAGRYLTREPLLGGGE